MDAGAAHSCGMDGERERREGDGEGDFSRLAPHTYLCFIAPTVYYPPPPVPPLIRQWQNANLVVRRRAAELEALMAQMEVTVATLTRELELVSGGGVWGRG